MAQANLQRLAESWPSPYVARTMVKTFSGGLITAKHIANLDSAGKGPAGRIRVGRKIAYNVRALISWMEARSQEVG